jgi:twinkle protein
MSKILRTKLPCPCGGSSDAYVEYDDGHGHCFGKCGGRSFQNTNHGETMEHVDDTQFSFQYLDGRGINTAIREKLGIITKVSAQGEPVEDCITYPNGTKQIRILKTKEFRTVGPNASEATLMFMDKFPAGSAKTVTITEGGYDAAALHQVLGANFPVVSVRSSSSARKDCATHAKYLDSFDRIYLALDADEPGQKAAKEIAQLFDFNKVFHLDLAAHKDANGFVQAGQSDQT